LGSATDGVQKEIAQLRTRVAALEREVETLKGAEREVVQLRSITQGQAKKEIRKLFARGDVYYISEVAEQLSLPDEQVVSVIQELEKQGAIQQHERL
jgi:predicted transcriptional regulator